MKTINTIMLLIVIVLIESCNNFQNFREKEMNDAYRKFKNNIPKKLLYNFPKTVNGKNTCFDVLFPEALKLNHKYCGVFIIYNLSDFSFDTLYKKDINNYSFVGIVKEKLLVKLEVVKSKDYQSEYKQNFSQKNVFIVPDYNGKFSPIKDTLSNNVETLIINTKIGKFLPEEYLVDKNKLPPKYKHGYSKGIFIEKSKHKMVYWLIVW